MCEIKAYLTLIGEQFNPDYVTQMLDIQPDTVRLATERLRNGTLFGHTEWGIHTDLMETCNVERVLELLLLRVASVLPIMSDVAKELNANWNVLIYVRSDEDDLPVIVFSQDTIHMLSAINAELGFDNYVVSDDGTFN